MGNGERLKKKQWIVGVVVLLALVALVVWGRDRIHFDFGVFRLAQTLYLVRRREVAHPVSGQDMRQGFQ